MRKLLLTIFVGFVVSAHSASARADVGLGLFIGEPTGIDLKLGLGNRNAIDLLLGVDTFREGHADYGHITYLVTPVVAEGNSVSVPVRVGVGVALYGTSGDLNVAVRVPLEVALRLHRTPLEFYGEIALALVLVDPANDLVFDGQGGIGFRIYF